MTKMKKLLYVSLAFIIVFSTNSLIFAKTNTLTDIAEEYESLILDKEILESKNYIIIDSEEKAKTVAKENLINLKKRREKDLSEIPKYTIENFEKFKDINGYAQENILSELIGRTLETPKLEEIELELETKKIFNSDYTEDELLEDFKIFLKNEKITDIADSNLKEHLTILRTNIVEDAILLAFQVADFPVSHDMFLHSISSSSPQNLSYQTQGRPIRKGSFGSMDLAPSIKFGFLVNPTFLLMLQAFARAGDYEYNNDGYHYEFNNDDLAYSIHGTTNIRFHRMSYDRAFFRIWDIYDFDGLLNKLLNLTTKTSEYGIIIEGLHDGSLQ